MIGLLTQAIGFLIPMLVALHFGAGSTTDAYYLAIAIPVLFISIIVGGAIRLVFIPVFIEENAKAPEQSQDIISGLAMALFGLSTIIMIIIGIALRFDLFSFSASTDTANLARDLSILLLPLIPLTVLFNLYLAVYQSHQKFARAEFANTLKFIIQVWIIWVFAKDWGIRSVVIGQLVGQLTAITMLMLLIKIELGINPLPRFVTHPGLSKMLKLSGLALLGFVIVRFNVFTARMLAGLLPEGSVTILSMAQKMALIPGLLISGAVGTVVTSYWAKELAEGRWDSIRGSFTKALSVIWMAIIPVSVGLYMVRVQLVNILFRRGEFSAESAIATAGVFVILAVEAIPVYMHNIIVRILHAQKALKELLWISIGGFTVGVGMMVLLAFRLDFGVQGIVMGVLCGTIFVSLTTAILVQRRYHLFIFRDLVPQILKVIFAACGMFLGAQIIMNQIFRIELLTDFQFLLIIGATGTVIYILLLTLLKHREFKILSQSLVSTLRS